MSPWLDFVLHGMATYRLSLMVTKEAGPGWVFKHFRRATTKKAHLDEGVECIFCMSIWFAAAMVVARRRWAGSPIYDGAISTLALSAAAVVLNQAFTRGKLT